MDYDFQVGDRVVVVGNAGYNHVKIGMTGTILGFYKPFERIQGVMVRWDLSQPRSSFHNCRGLCETGYGFNVPPDCITLLQAEETVYQIDISDADLLGLVVGKGVV